EAGSEGDVHPIVKSPLSVNPRLPPLGRRGYINILLMWPDAYRSSAKFLILSIIAIHRRSYSFSLTAARFAARMHVLYVSSSNSSDLRMRLLLLLLLRIRVWRMEVADLEVS